MSARVLIDSVSSLALKEKQVDFRTGIGEEEQPQAQSPEKQFLISYQHQPRGDYDTIFSPAFTIGQRRAETVFVGEAEVRDMADNVARWMEAAAREPTYLYPWGSLEADIENKGLETLPLVGYGSLVNPDSAAVTIRDRMGRTGLSVLSYGVRRIFNYVIPEGHMRYDPPSNPRARAALNVRFTGAGNDTVNGLLLEISLRDIQRLREREIGYDLYPVACVEWKNPEAVPFTGYILVCPDEERAGAIRTDSEIEPHREYYEICRSGATQMGKDFLKVWLTNTYLADGVTPVEQWEKEKFPEVRKE
ncbi:MAG: hypothetical protein BA864_04105 [Desulfuromonadales bacterium C00003093]|nr:MAG: hypothetical protein BA864_04105 [Desulfuromonadales bacterium C00003093]